MFHRVDKPVFAKNEKLEKLLTGQDESEGGVITMDQIGRVLVESDTCSFPVVGIWVKCVNLSEPFVFFKVYSFLKRRTDQKFHKLLTVFENRTYVYFVRVMTK